MALKGYSPVRGNVCDSRQKGARFRRKRCHEVTEGFQPTNNNLPTHKRSQQSAPRRLCAAKPHIFRAISTENTKPQVLSAAVRPIDETFPEAARLTAAYNLQASRHKIAGSADYRCPLAKPKPATLITHYALRITHFHSPATASNI